MAAVKVVHFADVHLGVENYGRLDPSTGLYSRLTDFLQAMRRRDGYWHALPQALARWWRTRAAGISDTSLEQARFSCKMEA